MPRVASENSVHHSKQHHPLGQRSRTADAEARQQSPFASLVEDTDSPPPTRNRGEHRSERTQTKRTAAAEDAPPTDRCAPAPDRSKTNDTKADELPVDTAETPTDAKAAAPKGETPPEGVAVECVEEIETVEAFEAEVEVAAATGDASVTQPAPVEPPALPPPPVALVALVVPVAPVVALAAEPAAPAPADGDETVDGATSGAVKDAPAGPVKKAPAADVPVIEPKAADVPKAAADKAGAKAAGTAETDTDQQTPAAAADADARVAAEADGSKTQATAEAPRSDTPRAVSEHDSTHHRADAHKPDDVPHQPLGAQVSEAAQGARPPAEAVHAVLQAADRAAAAATAQAVPAATQAPLEPAVPIAGLAVEIAARAQSGRNRFEIRLDPPELGRIDVRLDVDNSGQVTSRLVVERVETLEHLRRDAAELHRALQDAGLKTGDNSLQFTLRDQSFAGRDERNATPDPARLVVPDADLPTVDAAQSAYGRMVRAGGIDIRV